MEKGMFGRAHLEFPCDLLVAVQAGERQRIPVHAGLAAG